MNIMTLPRIEEQQDPKLLPLPVNQIPSKEEQGSEAPVNDPSRPASIKEIVPKQSMSIPAIPIMKSRNQVMLPTGQEENTVSLIGPTLMNSPDANLVIPQALGSGMNAHKIGQTIYKDELPPIIADPIKNPIDYASQSMARMNYQRQHPWGSSISAHPGIGGKIAHILSRVGNTAGDIFAPGTMSLLPGTDLNNKVQEHNIINLGEQGKENQLKQQQANAETTEANAKMMETTNNPNQQLQITRTQLGTNEAVLANPQATPAQKQEAIASNNNIYAQYPSLIPITTKTPGDNPVTIDTTALGKQLTTDYPDLTSGQISSLTSMLGNQPIQSTIDHIMTLAQTYANNNQRSQEILEQRKQAQQNHDDQVALLKDNKQQALANTAYNKTASALDNERKIIDPTLTRLETVDANLNLESAQADALVAPELLSLMAGGMGSGLRMTQSEINAVTQGRSSIQDVKAWAQKLASGKSITPVQRQQVRDIIQIARDRLQTQLTFINQEQDKADATIDPAIQRNIASETKEGMEKILVGHYATQEHYDQLTPAEKAQFNKQGYLLLP